MDDDDVGEPENDDDGVGDLDALLLAVIEGEGLIDSAEVPLPVAAGDALGNGEAELASLLVIVGDGDKVTETVADVDREPVEVTVGETVREGEGVGEGETEPVLGGDAEGVVDPLTVAVAEGVKVGCRGAGAATPRRAV